MTEVWLQFPGTEPGGGVMINSHGVPRKGDVFDDVFARKSYLVERVRWEYDNERETLRAQVWLKSFEKPETETESEDTKRKKSQ